MAAAVADRGIDVAAPEIDQRGRGGDADVDAGMRLLERGEPRQQPFGGQRGQRRDRQHMVVVLAQQPVGREPQIVKGGADAGQVIPGLRRQRQRAVLPDEQADPQLFLQPPDLMADRGLRDVQLGGRIGEAEVPGGGFERPQAIQRGQPARSFGRKIQCMSLSHLKRNKVSFAERPEERRYSLQQISFRR